MKPKIFNTEKADIMVVDLPALNLLCEIHNGYFVMDFTQRGIESKKRKINEGDRFGFFEAPEGNWQPLIFDEETSHKIVDSEFHEMTDEWFYKLYNTGFEDDFNSDTALESLQSLIDANVQKENPYEKPNTRQYSPKDLENDNSGFWKKFEQWQQEEAKTYHNPFYFFKLK